MWKLLSKRDRQATKEARQNPEAPLTVLTTAGVGQYVCGQCRHYGVGSEERNSCSQLGVPPDSMPCTLNPKRPLFEPAVVPAQIARVLGAMSLAEMATMSALLPNQIELLLRKERLNLPYRVGDHVGFVHNQTLVDGTVVDFDAENVTVLVDGAEVSLAHALVIPPKRTAAPTQPAVQNDTPKT